MAEVEVDLYGRDAGQLVDAVLSVEDAAVVGADELDVGPALVPAQLDGVASRARVADHVDADEAEARELVECPGRGQPGERVVDPAVVQLLVKLARELDATAGEVAGEDVVAIEAVVVGPGVEEQARVARAKPRAVAGEQVVVVEAPHHP